MCWSISTTRIPSRSIGLFVRREVFWSSDNRRIHMMDYHVASIASRLSVRNGDTFESKISISLFLFS